MKTRKNSRFKVNDLIVIILAVLLSGFCLTLFILDINSEQSKDEVNIAKVSSQENISERRFANRTVWARVKEDTLIYNGDYVRVDPLSSSEIIFEDGTKILVTENSLVKLYIDEEGNYATLSKGGGLVVDTSSGSSKFFVVTDEGKKVNVETGSLMTVGNNSGNLDVSVQKGKVSYDDEHGIKNSISNGAGFVLNTDGTVDLKPVVVLSPMGDERFLNQKSELYPVHFSWSKNLASVGNVHIEIAKEKNFLSVVYDVRENASKAECNIQLENGVYYWRLSCDYRDGTSTGPGAEGVGNGRSVAQSGKFQVIDCSKPKLLSPANGEVFSTRKGEISVPLRWTKKDRCSFYEVVIATDKELKNTVVHQNVENAGASFMLKEGIYYWNVRPFYTVNSEGFINESSVASFSVEKKQPSLPPQILAPQNKQVFYKSKRSSKKAVSAGNDNIYFSWRAEKDFSGYVITISDYEDFSNVIKNERLSDNFYSLSLSGLETEKNYYWKIYAITSDGYNTESTSVYNFSVTSNKELEEKIISPAYGTKVKYSEASKMNFIWRLEEADSYIIQLSKRKDFKDNIIQKETDNENISGIKLESGVWYWRVLDADEKSRSTNVGVFTVLEPPHIPQPVTLLSPKDKIVLQGEKTLVEPVSFYWTTDEKIKSATFVLMRVTKDKRRENVVSRKSLEKKQSVTRLSAGSYIWKIIAAAEDGTDISSEERSFEILPPAKLNAPVLVSPKQKSVLDTEYFKRNGGISFEWQKVAGATSYSLKIQKNDGSKLVPVVSQAFTQETLSYKLKDMSLLSNGDFEWTVVAEKKADDGYLIQSGNIAKGNFSVQVQLPGKIQVKDSGTQYGE